MIVQDVVDFLEELAPQAYSEDFDNTGLLTGNAQNKVTGILVTLDTLEEVIDEAVSKGCNLIVSFHPIIFSGLKKLTGKSYVERVVIKAIQNHIAIYAIHTALDNSFYGVNARICEMIGILDTKMLIPQKGTIKKLTTFVPSGSADKVRAALFAAGGGSIGNYDNCSFNVEGIGTFRGNEGSNPVIGVPGELHHEEEIQLNITYPKHVEQKLLKALFTHHPYEEVAYEITTLENSNQHIGMGMVGTLKQPMGALEFLNHVKKVMQTECIRHSALHGRTIKKVAVLGGSGAFAIASAIGAEADVFITADVKYHQFFQAEGKIIIADIGHYETEQFTKNLLVEYLTKKIHNFAPALPEGKVLLSDCNTNPVKYL